MAELENNEDINEDEINDDSSNNNGDNNSDKSGHDDAGDNKKEDDKEKDLSDITIEDYQKEKERRVKAEKTLVELKKNAKTKSKVKDDENKKTPNNAEEMRAVIAEDKFYTKNADAEPYRKEIEAYVKKGVSREDAYMITSKKDKEVKKTRDVYGKTLLGNSAGKDISIVSVDTFDKMTSKQQEEYSQKSMDKYGKVKLK